MNFGTKMSLACVAMLTAALPALGGVTVNSPANDTNVTAPFNLSASAADCSGKGVVAMGYSFDSSSDTAIVKDQSLDKSVDVSSGTHTLHIKAWAPGQVCVKDITVHVAAGASVAHADSSSRPEAVVPSDADTVSDIQALGGWQATHDHGATGSANGWTGTVNSPSMYGNARKFVTNFWGSGAERYSMSFSDNVDAKNFFYDAWVYFTSSASKLGNLELDTNQVMPNGETALIGVQCDGYSGTWAYNVNTGSSHNVRPHWQPKGGTRCNPRSWSRDTWHHVQVSFSRDDSGHVTYHSVWLDGVESRLNARAFVGASLGWGPVVNTQFQIDGLGSGQVTAYLDKLTVSMW